jgi:excisionase family DNA binding protein
LVTAQNKLAVSIAEAADVSGMSRAFLYEAMAASELSFLKIGRRRLILIVDLLEWLTSKRSKTA